MRYYLIKNVKTVVDEDNMITSNINYVEIDLPDYVIRQDFIAASLNLIVASSINVKRDKFIVDGEFSEEDFNEAVQMVNDEVETYTDTLNKLTGSNKDHDEWLEAVLNLDVIYFLGTVNGVTVPIKDREIPTAIRQLWRLAVDGENLTSEVIAEAMTALTEDVNGVCKGYKFNPTISDFNNWFGRKLDKLTTTKDVKNGDAKYKLRKITSGVIPLKVFTRELTFFTASYCGWKVFTSKRKGLRKEQVKTIINFKD